MRFEPKDDQVIENERQEKLKAIQPVAPDNYYFEVVSAEDQVSKTSGNEMIKLQLRIHDKEANERYIFDYILPAFAKKLKHFCDVAGLQDAYDTGTLTAADCIGRVGRCDVDIEKGKRNPDGGFYPDRNVVVDYSTKIPGSEKAVGGEVNAKKPEVPFDDDVPF